MKIVGRNNERVDSMIRRDQTLTDRPTRESNIELLKIIAIIFIVLSHSMPDGDTARLSSAINMGTENNPTYIVLQVMHNLGQIGNDIFLVCSFWFLLSSKKIKSKKIISLMMDALFVSLISLSIFLLIGFRFPLEYFIRQFAPNLFGNNWFLACYLSLYAIHPGLNLIIESLKDKTLFLTSFILGMMYCVIYFVLRNGGIYYNELIGFIVIYFLVAAVKRANVYEKVSKKKMSLAIAISGLLMITVNYISVEITDSLYSRWNIIINPLFLIIAFSSFGIAIKTKIAVSKCINYISSLSLLVYITHTNRIMRDYVRYAIFDWIKLNYTYHNLLLWCLLFFAFNLIYGMFFAVLYKESLQKAFERIAGFIDQKLGLLYDMVWLHCCNYRMKLRGDYDEKRESQDKKA